MVRTYSLTEGLGTLAPSFTLPAANPQVDDVAGDFRSLADYADAEAVVVVFTCNHCPYAVHVEDALIEMARAYQSRGIQFVGISANDAELYPVDSFENMVLRAEEKGYSFPYLYDESQAVAKAYGAQCTPDFFVCDKERRFVYLGRFDDTRPGMGRATGDELREALEQLLETGTIAMEQYPSIGCNIKWKRG